MEVSNLLQGLANEEAVDIFLYKKEGSLFREKIISGERIGEKFKQFAQEEAYHIEALAAISKTKIKVQKREMALSSSLRKTLRVHLKRETESIEFYKKLFFVFNGNKEKKIIEKIIDQEKSHLASIKKYLFLLD